MIDTRFHKMAKIIIHYSTRVQPGDTVFIRGLSPLAQPLIQACYQEALKIGAQPFSYLHISDEDALTIEATDDIDLLSTPNPMLMQMYETADVVIGIHAQENLSGLSAYPPAKVSARARAKYAPINIQKVRQAQKTIRRCTTIVPTQAYAQAAGMSLLRYSDFLFRACKVHLDNPVEGWKALYQHQQKLVEFLADKKTIRLSGTGVDLSFSIEERPFINSAGRANFPDGEIFTAPVENSVNGWVRFSYPAYYEGVEVNGIELEFRDGLIVNANAEKNESFLLNMLDTDDGSRRLGEFGIGTNSDIQQFTGAILFDEKMNGTIHLAIGQGHGETGSLNQSGVHWDMVHDMRQGKITVDDAMVYQDGRFLI